MKTRKFKENTNRKIAIVLSLALILSTFMELNVNAAAIGINGTNIQVDILSSNLEDLTSAEAVQYMLDYYADDPFFQARNNPNFNWYLEISKAAYKTTEWFLGQNSQGISNEELFEVMTYEQWKQENPSMIIEFLKGDVNPGTTKAAYWEWFFTKFGYDSSKQKYRLTVDTYIPALGRTVTDYVYGTKPSDFFDHVPIEFWSYFVQTQAEWFYNIFQRESSYRNIEQSITPSNILGAGSIITNEFIQQYGLQPVENMVFTQNPMTSSTIGYISLELFDGKIIYGTLNFGHAFNSRKDSKIGITKLENDNLRLIQKQPNLVYDQILNITNGKIIENGVSTIIVFKDYPINVNDVKSIDWLINPYVVIGYYKDSTRDIINLDDYIPTIFPNININTLDPSIIRPEELDLKRQGFAPDILNPPSDIPIPIPGLEDIPLPGILTPDIPDVLNPDLPWEYPDDAPPFVIDQDGNVVIPWDYTWPWDEPAPIPIIDTNELDFPIPPIPPILDDRESLPTMPNLVYLLGIIFIRILVLLLKALQFVRSLVDLQPSSSMIQADILASIENMRDIIIPGFNIKFQVFAQWVVVFVSSISIVGIIRKRIDRFKA